jgi:hypothetical protein
VPRTTAIREPTHAIDHDNRAHSSPAAAGSVIWLVGRHRRATNDQRNGLRPTVISHYKLAPPRLGIGQMADGNSILAGDGPAPTDGVSSDVLAAIEASQPYKIRGKAARRDASLQILAVISNADKHRAIPVVRMQLASDSIDKRTVSIEPRRIYSITSKVFAKPGTVIEAGAEIVRLKTRHIAPPDTNVNVYPLGAARGGHEHVESAGLGLRAGGRDQLAGGDELHVGRGDRALVRPVALTDHHRRTGRKPGAGDRDLRPAADRTAGRGDPRDRRRCRLDKRDVRVTFRWPSRSATTRNVPVGG